MKTWIIGLLAAGAAPFAWGWLKTNLPKILAGQVMKEIRLGLAGGGIADVDVKELLSEIVMCLVRFAERKLPGKGLGDQRMRLLLDLSERAPLIGPYLKTCEPQLRALIEDCVDEMESELVAEVPLLPAPEKPKQ